MLLVAHAMPVSLICPCLALSMQCFSHHVVHFGRGDKFDEANSLGGIGPVATFLGPLVNPKLGLLSPQAGTDSHLPTTIPELDTLDDSPLHTPRSADSASSMKSAFSTMHPTSISGGQSIHSRRTSAVGEPLAEFEDVFDADDLEIGARSDREDASLLHSNVSRQSFAHSTSSEPHAHLGSELSHDHGEGQSAWSGVFQNPAVVKFGQATKSWGSKLRGKYAEYRETRL